MAYKVQTRDQNGKWRDLRFAGPSHSHLETAISVARSLDEDGLFLKSVRIVDDIGNVIMKGDNR